MPTNSAQRLADEEKAKRKAEIQASRDEKKAQTKEITRRFPGLQRSLRTLHLLGTEIREHKGRFASMKTRIYLEDPNRYAGEVTIEERDANAVVYVWGNANVAVLRAVLKAGIAAYVDSQPLTHCAHCSARILCFSQGEDDGFWWHVATAKTSCTEGDTKAEPADVPRETSTPEGESA